MQCCHKYIHKNVIVTYDAELKLQ